MRRARHGAWSVDGDGSKRKHYHVRESVGIAVRLLIAALHHASLATLRVRRA